MPDAPPRNETANGAIRDSLCNLPALAAVFLFAGGIAFGRPSAVDPAVLLAIAAAAAAVFRFSPARMRIVFISAILLGAGCILLHDHRSLPPHHVSRFISDERVTVAADFVSLESRRIRNDRVLLNIVSVNGDPVTGAVQSYAGPGALPPNVLPGDRLIIPGAVIKKIRGFHNIGGWDYEQHMRDRNIGARLILGKGTPGAIIAGSRWTWRRPFEKLKRGLRSYLQSTDRDVDAVMTAMLLGDQGRVTPELRDTFSRAGTAHLLAVSGLHVGFIAAASYFLFKLIAFYLIYPVRYRWASAGVPMRIAAAGAIMAVTTFALFTGPRLPALRAMIMVDTYLLAVLFGRGRDFYGAFALAMAAILLTMPWSLFSAGFQLSFAAVFFIALFMERWWKPVHDPERTLEDLVPPWWRAVWEKVPVFGSFAFVSLFAYIGSGAIAAYHFNTIPVYGVLVNTILVPVASVAVPLGVFGCLLFSPWIIALAAKLIGVIVFVSQWTAGQPFSFVHIGAIPAAALVFYYAALGVVFLFPPGARRRRWFAVASAGFFVAVAIGPVASGFDRRLTVRFVDVGQADATVVTWPGGALVIDAGRSFPNFDTGRSIIAPVLWRAHRTRLTAAFGTHGDRDHIGGMAGLLDRTPTPMIATHNRLSRSGAFNKLRAKALLDGTWRPVKSGDRFEFPGGLTVEVFNPPENVPPYPDDDNNRSLVLKLTFGDVRILTVGDIGEDVEQWLIDSGADLRADVLKVAHHGSKTSSSERFLKKVGARYAVISAGYKNYFGHPHIDVLRRLTKAGAAMYRTDLEGEVVMTTDGREIWFTTYGSTAGN